MKSTLCALFALALPAAAFAAPAKPAAPTKPAVAGKSQIDARGIAALDKAADYYQKQRSFAVSATETVTSGRDVIRSSRLQIGLQAPYRASLKVTSLDEKDQPNGVWAAYLMNAKSLIGSVLEQPAETETLSGGLEARQKKMVDVFRQNPGVLMSILTLAAGENMAREAHVKSVQMSEVRVGGRALKRVTVTRQDDSRGPLTAELWLAPSTYAVEKVVVRGQNRDKTVVVTTEFGPLVANWKGSQSATDAAIYSWNKVAPGIVLASEIPATKIVIDPKARAIFARAQKLYGAAQSLSVRWKGTDDFDQPAQSSLDFDRAGRLRLGSTSTFASLLVFDGKDRWELDPTDVNEPDQLQYTRMEADEAELSMELALAPDMARALGDLLFGIDPLDTEKFAGNLEITEFRATLLAPQPFGGQSCDLVRLTQNSGKSGDKKNPLWSEQQTFWFARSDGRLMRLQERVGTASQAMSASDSQIIAQTFNPTFAPDTFKFTPPKGAVLSKD